MSKHTRMNAFKFMRMMVREMRNESWQLSADAIRSRSALRCPIAVVANNRLKPERQYTSGAYISAADHLGLVSGPITARDIADAADQPSNNPKGKRAKLRRILLKAAGLTQ
jgi:hypothetical protein